MSEIALSVKDLQFSIQKKVILSSLTFQVPLGKVFSVVGHNGAGKTTLFHLILGLKIQKLGSIELFGQSNLNFKSRQDLGYVPERPYLNLELTLASFLRFHAELISISKNRISDEILRVASLVSLEGCLNQKLSTFSKGMLQKTLLAQASLGNPQLLIFDEPMSGLDPESRESVKQQILRLKDSNKTIIFSSHSLDDVAQLSDMVLHLKEGKASFLGTTSDWNAQK